MCREYILETLFIQSVFVCKILIQMCLSVGAERLCFIGHFHSPILQLMSHTFIQIKPAMSEMLSSN